MEREEKTIVLSGWGIDPAECAKIFGAKTQVLAPTRENVSLLTSEVSNGSANRVVGYSLGAWLLLEAAAQQNFSFENVTLYAPFLAFPREVGKGGRIATTQIKFLRRWLKKNPAEAIADFYVRAGISFVSPSAETLPSSLDELDAGLKILAEEKLECVPVCAKNWKIFLGENDALLDAHAVAKTFSENPVHVVPAGTHDLRTLLARA